MTDGSVAGRRAATGWHRDGQSLVRELEFRDFSDAVSFLECVAAAAQDHLRRPDMCILRYNRVRLTITNPHHAGLTLAEMRLASKVNAVIDEQLPANRP
jgi:4a-hydroxytetrahydrobiopterin dehydratase